MRRPLNLSGERAGWECVVAWAIVNAGLLPASVACRVAPVNVQPSAYMRECPACGRLFFSACLDCLYKGETPGERAPRDADLCEQLAALRASPAYLAEALEWMGGEYE